MDIIERKRIALMHAKNCAGSWSALARVCGVRPTVVYNWYHRNKEVTPARHVIAIEKLTGVSRHVLRPDVFGEILL